MVNNNNRANRTNSSIYKTNKIIHSHVRTFVCTFTQSSRYMYMHIYLFYGLYEENYKLFYNQKSSCADTERQSREVTKTDENGDLKKKKPATKPRKRRLIMMRIFFWRLFRR